MGRICSFWHAYTTIAMVLGCTSSWADSAPPTEARIRIAVCNLAGEGLPRGATSWLSELITREIEKTDNLTTTGMLECGSDTKRALDLGRQAGAAKVITGRVVTVADLFVVELSLLNTTSGKTEANQTVEVVASPLDPRSTIRVATQQLLGIGGESAFPEAWISVSSTPPGAKVYVGDLLEGRAPLTLSVKPGAHSLKATLPEYAPWALDVDVKNSETLSLNASLGRALVATQAKSHGGQLILGFVVPYVTALGEATLYVAEVQTGRPYFGWLLVAPPATYLIASDMLGNQEIDIGRAWMIVSSGLWGAAWGALGVGTSGLDSPRPYVAMSLASSVVGLVTAVSVTEHREISRKRVSFINTGGFLGSAVGLGIPYLLDISRPRVYNMSLLAGGLLGIAISASLTSDLDFVERESQHARLQLNPEVWLPDDGGEFTRRGPVSDKESNDFRYGLMLRFGLN